jgi:hypothetical protein
LPYDLVMLLRHLCQLTSQPPQGFAEVLLPAIVARMPNMTMQELSCLLHVAVVWRLDCKLKLATAVAALVGVAAGLPAAADAAASAAAAAVPANSSSDAGWLLDEQLANVMQPNAAAKPQEAAAAGAGGQPLPPRQQHLMPRTAADPVILLHRMAQCGLQPPRPLFHWLLKQIGPHLHKISLLQGCLLRRTLVYAWKDSYGCQQVLEAGLEPWLTSSGNSRNKDGSSSSNSSSNSSSSSSEHRLRADLPAEVSLNPDMLQLPYWQVKALLIAAGRFGVLAAEVRQQHGNGTAAAAAGGSSGSDGGRGIAVTFVTALLNHLSCHPQHLNPKAAKNPATLVTWRSDVILALFWAAARLGLRPEPRLLQAGLTALVCKMKYQIAFKELVHLVWVAGVLQLNDAGFVRVLTEALVAAADKLHPKSIAGNDRFQEFHIFRWCIYSYSVQVMLWPSPVCRCAGVVRAEHSNNCGSITS